MRNSILTITSAAAVVTLTAACGSGRDTATAAPAPVRATQVLASTPPQAAVMIKAYIYKTNGNYADNVPIAVKDGKLISYPAPSDLADRSEPVALDGGYLLDRRGVGPDTRFTTYTYGDYAAMQAPPSESALMAAIIPDARVTEIVEMPFPYTPDCASQCNELIAAGLPGCKIMKF